MKKIACLSALACVVALSTASAFASQSTVSLDYAQGDAQGQINKQDGFNLKYRYEFDNSQWGVIGSFTYVENEQGSVYADYYKGQYYSLTAGPSYRLNDWISAYGVIGLGYGKFRNVEDYQSTARVDNSMSDYGFSYGAGLQVNPINNVAVDVSYEQSRIRSVDEGVWMVGLGYHF
jgi:outer membrane protein X